jgi:tripartite-type tricarboxylate transporter receptor subunit TctC
MSSCIMSSWIMSSWMRGARGMALVLGFTSAALDLAAAQDFPSKPIRMVIGLSAGGGTDVTGRLIAQKMSEIMKTTVVVENKPGGNFIPAAKEVLASPADGHTLYFISSSSLITQALHPDYPADLLKFAAITEVSTGPLILVARNDLGLKSIKDVIDYARKNPGKLKFGTGGGTGSSLYLATALLKTTAKLDVDIVPYRGSGPALNDLLGGHIDLMFDAMPMMSAQAKEGKVTPVVITGGRRSAALPEVATMQENGLSFEITGWYGILAPPDTPAPIVQRLRDEAAKAVGQTDVIEKLALQGMVPRGTQPAEFARYMKSELDFYTKIIKDAGIKPE